MPTDQLRPVKSYQRAIEVLGGTAAAARALKTTQTTICQWRTRKGAFPAEQYFVVQGELKRLGYKAAPQAFTFVLAR